MDVTKELKFNLQFRCPTCDFKSHNAKPMQDHLLVCTKTPIVFKTEVTEDPNEFNAMMDESENAAFDPLDIKPIKNLESEIAEDPNEFNAITDESENNAPQCKIFPNFPLISMLLKKRQNFQIQF